MITISSRSALSFLPIVSLVASKSPSLISRSSPPISSSTLSDSASVFKPTPASPYPTPSGLSFNNDASASVSIYVNQDPPDDVHVDLEWTALGDSYASGVGTTKYVDGLRCLRYDEAYPVIMNLNPYYNPGGVEAFPPGVHKLNNVVCSGAEAQDILDWQLLDQPTSGQPDYSFGSRPAFGNPELATLTAGGDDIDFPGILFNCILGASVKGGPPKRTCDDQRAHTWSLLNSQAYVGDLGKVIDAIMTKGRAGTAGNDFRLYVTGYARFFNSETTAPDTNCDGTTFATEGIFSDRKPLGPNGPRDMYLTQDLRREFNNMSESLNAGIQNAVKNYNDDHVKFVDIQTDRSGADLLAGHRFCEQGVTEPAQDNANLWYWHFPYSGRTDSNEAPNVDDGTLTSLANLLETAWVNAANVGSQNINSVYPNEDDFLGAVFTNITQNLVSQDNLGSTDNPTIWGGYIGWRTKVFHPQFPFHRSIMTSIFAQYILDTKQPRRESSRTSSVSKTPATGGFIGHEHSHTGSRFASPTGQGKRALRPRVS